MEFSLLLHSIPSVFVVFIKINTDKLKHELINKPFDLGNGFL